jgi:glycosyltransferase involved in cell wall biosynthesis
MRLLFLTTDLSYPPTDGRMLRTYNVLEGLAARHDIHLICYDQRHGEDPDERRRVAEAQLRSLCASVDVFEIPSKRSRALLASTVAASLLEGSPFSSRAYRSQTALRRLEVVAAARDLDVVHVENTLLGEHIDGRIRAARVLVHHNVESELFQQRAAAERNFARRVFLGLEARKMRALETRLGPRFGAHIACSSADADRLRSIMGDVRVCVVPNGVDLGYFSPPSVSPSGAGVVHVGGLNWPPNLHAAAWLCDAVWPLVLRTAPQATLTFVGRTGSAPVSRWMRNNVAFAGEVADVRPYYAEAVVSVVPLHVGGGTRLKILNAWAMGTPVVSTSKGCEGLPARHGENLLVADAPSSFAAAVVRLLGDSAMRAALGAAGRRAAEAEFGWQRIVELTERAYGEARQGAR